MAAVTNDYRALEYSHFFSPKVLLAAIANNTNALNMIPQQPPEFYIYAFMMNPLICKDIKDPNIIQTVINNDCVKQIEKILVDDGIDLEKAVSGDYKKQEKRMTYTPNYNHMHNDWQLNLI